MVMHMMVDMSSDVPAMNLTPDSPFSNQTGGVRAVVSITCFLSMIGSLLIIASYVFFKELRTRVRLILVHLSVMDFGVGLANFIGVTVYFNQYYQKVYHGNETIPFIVNASCIVQATVALFCTNSSVLWTIMLAMYLYFLIVHSESSWARYSFYIFGALCYILPLIVTVWLLVEDRLGYSPYDSSGWCTIKVYHADGKVDLFTSILGYDIWILLTMVLVPFLYLAIRLHVRNRYQRLKSTMPKDRLKSMLQAVDTKFTLIPVIFIALRMWTMIITIIYDYAQIPDDKIPYPLALTLDYLAGFGDSAQGAANGVLFVFFTRRVRRLVLCMWCCKRHKDGVGRVESAQESKSARQPSNNFKELSVDSTSPLLPNKSHSHSSLYYSQTSTIQSQDFTFAHKDAPKSKT